jgi:hypothetical protein
MVWPRKPSSSSPPLPASTGAEMERPLPISPPPADRTPELPVEAHEDVGDGSEGSTTADVDLTARKDVDDGSDGSASLDVDLTSRKDVGDNSNRPTTPVVNPTRSKKAMTVQRKAKYSLPRLLVIGACVSYLFVQVWGLTLALHFVNDYASARVREAEYVLTYASGDLARERTMYKQLEQLSNTELQWKYMESYQHCLVRGLFTAKKSFPFYAFEKHPDARNQTLDWVSENCDKLFFTPQVHPSNMSLLRKVAEDARRVAKDALALLKYRALLLRRRFRGTNVTRHATTANQIAEELQISRENTRLLSLFRLDCDESTRCRLVYAGKDSRLLELARREFANANKDILKWSFPFKMYLHTSKVLLSALYFMHAFLLVCSAIALHLSLPQLRSPPGQFFKSILADLKLRIRQLFDHRGMSANIILFWVWGVMCMPLRWRGFSDRFTCLNMLLPVDLIVIAIFTVSCSLAFFFLIIESKRNARNLYRASTELWKILQGDEAFLDSLSKKGTKGTKRTSTSPPTAPAAKPASKIGARPISPATSLAEDLQQARETLHAERDQTSDDDEAEDTSSSSSDAEDTASSSDDEHTSGSETVSDIDSDDDSAASYIDLTGGATPAISDEGSEHGSDWAVVQE